MELMMPNDDEKTVNDGQVLTTPTGYKFLSEKRQIHPISTHENINSRL